MLISIDPIPLQLGEVGVGWFGLAALAGLLAGIGLSLRLAGADGLPRGPLLDALAWTIPVGVVAARLVYVLGTWDQHVGDNESLWQLPLTGLSLWGGLAGGGLVAMALLGARGVDRRRVADVVASGLALAIAIGRFGELLQGIGQGLPTTLPWGVAYASPLAGAPDVGVPRHPVQLYDGLLALVLLGAVLVSRRWTIAPGVRWWTFLAVYGAGRILLGQLRLDPAFLFGLQIEQLLAGAAVLVALLALSATLLATPVGAASPVPVHMSTPEVTLYGKPGCHLCESAEATLAQLGKRYPHRLRVRDITADPALFDRYGQRIPVVMVGGTEYDAPLTPALLERALRKQGAA